MFGMADNFFFPGNDAHMGEQVRGFGFNNEGGIPTISRFLSGTTDQFGFNQSPGTPGGFPPGPTGELMKAQVEAFLFAFDSNLAPIVGQQVTLTETNAAVAGPRIDLLLARANAQECDLVAKGLGVLQPRGFMYVGGGQFRTDRQASPPVADALLRQLVAVTGRELTYTCTPPGSGQRIGVDRDSDGVWDGDERVAGSDPANPASTP